MQFLPKLEELVERSKGKIRADKAHQKITAMGYAGSERTTRRAVAALKAAWQADRRRVHRPWIPEPGMWAQYDFGDGPRVGGAATVPFCLWLAWSRFRVVLPLLDKSGPSVRAAVDVALRRAGGVPAYLLTDNEKTVTAGHMAGIPVRNPGAVEFGRYYGLTVATCVPYDSASKGGSESTVKIAKPDLVPTDANLLPEYASFAELEAACLGFCGQVNARPHRNHPPPLDAGLEALQRRMRLPHMRRIAPEVLATAKAPRWDPAEVLRALLTEEVPGRDRSALATRRTRAAFPTGKTFAAWDPHLSSVPDPTQQALRTLEWISRHENLVVCGPSGTGKTFLLEALGQAAVHAGRHVAWFTLEQRGVLIRRHRADNSVTKAIGRILRAGLVVVDDIGLLPVGPDAAEGLYRLVDAAYEKRSVAVSSNLHPS